MRGFVTRERRCEGNGLYFEHPADDIPNIFDDRQFKSSRSSFQAMVLYGSDPLDIGYALVRAWQPSDARNGNLIIASANPGG